MKSKAKENPYIHGYSEEEQKRLYEQADVLGPAIFEGLDLSDVETVLEIGCGVGAQTKNIIKRWPHLKLTSIDKDPNQLKAANSYLQDEVKNGKVSLKLADGEKCCLADKSFDAVVVIWILEHVGHPEALLAEAHRVLKPNGRLILVEVDNSTMNIEPIFDSINNWWQKLNQCQLDHGGDPFIGKRLHQISQEVGFEFGKYKRISLVSNNGDSSVSIRQLSWLRDLYLSASGSLMSNGYICNQDIAKLKDSFRALENSPIISLSYTAVRYECQKSKELELPSYSASAPIKKLFHLCHSSSPHPESLLPHETLETPQVFLRFRSVRGLSTWDKSERL